MSLQEFVEIINKTNSYEDFHNTIRKISNSDKGKLQEYLIKYYFHSHAKMYDLVYYYARICDTLPEEYLKNDWGTDGYILHSDGKVSLVQVKYRSNPNSTMCRSYLGNMALEAGKFKDLDKFRHLYLVTDCDKIPKNISEDEIKSYNVKFLMSDILWNMDWELLKALVMWNGRDNISFTPPPLREWQKEALEFYTKNEGNRCQIIAPCGGGKSRVMWEISKIYNRVLIVVPTLHLLSQTFELFAKYSPEKKYILVGTDMDNDSEEAIRVPYDMTTNALEIKNLTSLINNYVIISTYHSLNQVINLKFDLTIADEAHRICGNIKSDSSIPIRDDFISKKRVYFTATPKIYYGSANNEKIVSMDNENLFGPKYIYSFRKAIEDEIISDYTITTAHHILEENYVFEDSEFNSLFLYKSLIKYEHRSVLIFNNNHEKSREMYNKTKEIFEKYNFSDYELILMPKNAKSSDKSRAVRKIRENKKVIIFNVRVFTLGSDLPELQSVMLCGSRFSKIDIVQSVSRCLRKTENKSIGNILIPCLIRGNNYDDDGNFESLRRFLVAMGSVDEALVEEILLRSKGKVPQKQRIFNMDIFDLTEDIMRKIDENEFTIKIFQRIALNSKLFGEEIWREKLNLTIEYIKLNKRTPRSSGEKIEKDERILGKWLTHQRENYKNFKHILSIQKIRIIWEQSCSEYYQLNSVDNLKLWKNYLEGYINFIKTNRNTPRINSDSKYEQKLAKWISIQRRNYVECRQIMSDPEVREIWRQSCISYPQLNSRDNKVLWNENMFKCIEWININNRLPKTNGGNIDTEEKRIGVWLCTQRKTYREYRAIMKDQEIRKTWEQNLKLYPQLNVISDTDAWKKNLENCIEWIKNKGRVPRINPKLSDEYEKKLGKWISHQRENYIGCKHLLKIIEIRIEWEKACISYPKLSNIEIEEISINLQQEVKNEDDLYSLNLGELKNIARNLKIIGFSKYKISERETLIKIIEETKNIQNNPEPIKTNDFAVLNSSVDLSTMSVKELKERAKLMGLVGVFRFKKSELIEAIESNSVRV